MHHYIKNGKPFASKEPIYFFEWVYGTGHVKFGKHCTQAEYDLDRDCDAWGGRTIVREELVQEVIPQLP